MKHKVSSSCKDLQVSLIYFHSSEVEAYGEGHDAFGDLIKGVHRDVLGHIRVCEVAVEIACIVEGLVVVQVCHGASMGVEVWVLRRTPV